MNELEFECSTIGSRINTAPRECLVEEEMSRLILMRANSFEMPREWLVEELIDEYPYEPTRLSCAETEKKISCWPLMFNNLLHIKNLARYTKELSRYWKDSLRLCHNSLRLFRIHKTNLSNIPRLIHKIDQGSWKGTAKCCKKLSLYSKSGTERASHSCNAGPIPSIGKLANRFLLSPRNIPANRMTKVSLEVDRVVLGRPLKTC